MRSSTSEFRMVKADFNHQKLPLYQWFARNEKQYTLPSALKIKSQQCSVYYNLSTSKHKYCELYPYAMEMQAS